MPWILKNLFTVIFHIDMKSFIKRLLFYVTISAVSIVATYLICVCVPLDGILALIVRLIICVVIPNAIYLFAYKRTTEFKGAVGLVDKMVGHRIAPLHKILGKLM